MSHSSEFRSNRSPDGQPEEGAPLRGGAAEVMKLALPVVLTHLSITAMQIVDSVMVGSVMVGQLGSPQLASVGFGGVWMWTLVCFFVGTTSCVQTFVSQHYGGGNHRECGQWPGRRSTP
jgi:Na+-driven multidrug efflux pump